MWYSLRYITKSGESLKLYNLQLGGAMHVEQAQRGLGSHSFERLPQTRHFSQNEIDAARKTDARI